MPKTSDDVIGLIPAAGRGTRLGALPCSKEIYPVGFKTGQDGTLRPRVSCSYLLEKMQFAGIKRIYVILRSGKWDIPAYFGDGHTLNANLAYLIARLPYGVPYTLDQAFPFVHDKRVALGFPDILFQPDDAYEQLLNHQSETNADVVLALLPTNRPQKWDMVELDRNGKITGFTIKPAHTHLRYTWTIGVWTPAFTRFLHEYVQEHFRKLSRNGSIIDDEQEELFVGHIFQAALAADMHIENVPFPNHTCLDIGTPEDLVVAANQFKEGKSQHGHEKSS